MRSRSRMRALAGSGGALVVAVLGALGGSCGEPNGEPAASHKRLIDLHAFPNGVEPGGSAAVVVVVRGECAARPSTCTVCVGLPPDRGDQTSGAIYWPGVIESADPQTLRLSNVPLDEPVTMTYRAPLREGSEVVTATLFRSSVDCPTLGADGGGAPPGAELLSSTSVRITVGSSASVTGTDGADTGAETSTDASAADEASDGDASDQDDAPGTVDASGSFDAEGG